MPADLVASWTLCTVGVEPRLAFGGSVGGHLLGSRAVIVSAEGSARLQITRDATRPYEGAGHAVAVAPEFVAAVPADPSAPAAESEVHAPGPMCAVHDGDGTTVVVGVDPLGVRVAVPPGAGALVSSDADPAAVSVVADNGRRYPLAGAAAAASLGVAGRSPLVLPAAVLAMIPEGPRLSTTDARGGAG
jgi:hypothetical protein